MPIQTLEQLQAQAPPELPKPRRRRWLTHVLILAIISMAAMTPQSPGIGTFSRIYFKDGTVTGPHIRWGSASPNGSVTAPKGSVYLRTADGTLWMNTNGATTWSQGSTSTGDVTAASTLGTDECLIRADGTSTKGIQSSVICVTDSGVVTNMIIDAEGTGNTITIPAKIVFPWAVCQGGTGSLVINYKTVAPTAGCITGSNIDYPIATSPDSDGDYNGVFFFPLPGDFTGTVDVRGKWRTSATSGDAVFQFKWACTADAEVANDTWSSASTTTETAKGTTLQWNSFAITGVTLTGCAADEHYAGMVFRNRTNGSDTLAAALDYVTPIEFTFRRGM